MSAASIDIGDVPDVAPDARLMNEEQEQGEGDVGRASGGDGAEARPLDPLPLQGAHDEVKEVEAKWDAYREAFGDFSAGFDEFIARLSAILSG
jgi:hypothetical protein